MLFPVFLAFGQSPLIGERAPDIQIDQWLQPRHPIDLHQRPVLLYAWSLNCEECLRAFQHIDSLAQRFSERYHFVAISNNNPRWVRRLLRKRDVGTIFVTDDRRRTFNSFGLQGLPTVVIITPDQIIRWSGHPRELTGALLESISGMPLEVLTARGASATAPAPLPPQLLTVEISRTFGPAEPRLQTQANAITFSGYTFSEAVSYLSGSTQARIVFPADSTAERLNVFITSPELNFPDLREMALQHLLLLKRMKMETLEDEREVFLLSQVDTSKLYRHLADPGRSGMNFDLKDGQLSAGNFSLPMLANFLENQLGQIVDLGIQEEGRFNFALKVEDWESIRQTLLEEYGLTVVPAKKKVRIMHVKSL